MAESFASAREKYDNKAMYEYTIMQDPGAQLSNYIGGMLERTMDDVFPLHRHTNKFRDDLRRMRALNIYGV